MMNTRSVRVLPARAISTVKVLFKTPWANQVTKSWNCHSCFKSCPCSQGTLTLSQTSSVCARISTYRNPLEHRSGFPKHIGCDQQRRHRPKSHLTLRRRKEDTTDFRSWPVSHTSHSIGVPEVRNILRHSEPYP